MSTTTTPFPPYPSSSITPPQVGAGVPQLYKRVREARFHTKSEDRQTFRTGLVYLVGLGVADVFVCSL